MSEKAHSETEEVTQPPVVQTFALPSDPLLSSQWNLNNTGQTGSLSGIDLNVFQVWEDYTGAGVRVGVIDDGVEHSHFDLTANYAFASDYDAADGDNDAAAVGSDRHGTAVAGIIAADDNGVGSVGVAFDASIAGFRMAFGSGTSNQILQNLSFQDDVDISNNSWGFGGFFFDNLNGSAFASHGAAIRDAVANGRDGLGTVWNFAAGNSRAEGQDVNYHGYQNSRFTNAIAAAEDDGDITFYSTPGASILTTAPVAGGGGLGGVITTDRTGSAGYSSGDVTSGFNGTSAATPMVSGVTALMLEANPNLGYRDVQEILAYSSRQIDPTDSGWQINGAGDWNGGGLHVSHDFGFGLVDALAAVRLSESWTKQSVLSNESSVTFFDSVGRTINDNATVTETISVTQTIDLQWVEVHLDLSHTWIGDLTVSLESPDGTISDLVDRPGKTSSNRYGTSQDNIDFVLTSTQHWGESTVGDWTIRVRDNDNLFTGSFTDWRLTLYGDVIDADDEYIYTNEYGVLAGGDASRQSLSDLDGGTDRINAAALSGDAEISLVAGETGSIAGRAFTVAAGSVIEDLYAGDGNDTLTGNDAANLITGARGNDIITGGGGDDTLVGGRGNDTFVYSGGDGSDLISDFQTDADLLAFTSFTGFGNRAGLIDAATQNGSDLSIAVGGTDALVLAGLDLADLNSIQLSFEAGTAALAAHDDTFVIDEDSIVALDVLTNDIAGPSGSLSYAGFSTSHGGVAVGAHNTLIFTPDENFFGLAVIDYTITDGTAFSSARIDITVTAINDAPSAADDVATVDAGVAARIDVLANDTDVDGDSLSIVSATANSGSVGIAADGSLTYVSAPGAVGADLVQYTITDGELTSTAEVAVTVVNPNRAPEATDDSATTDEDVAVSIDVLGNDLDPDGDTLSVTAATAIHGNVTIEADGSLTYIGAADFNGMDTISYAITDGELTASAHAVVTVNPINDAPVAVGDAAVTDEDVAVVVDVLANDADIDGDALTVTSATAVHGSVTIGADGRLTYVGDTDFNGSDTVSYTVSDGELTATANVAVTVNAVNDAPVALNDVATTDEDIGVTIDVLANDQDIDGDTLTVTAVSATNGRVTVGADGRLTYIGDTDFHGTDTISYTVSDGELTAVANVAVTVNAVNDAPLVVDEIAATDDDVDLNINVLANDSDPEGGSLTLVAVAVANGSAVIEADGSLTYSAANNFSGVDTISYTVSDGALTDTGQVLVTVTSDDDVLIGTAVDDSLYGGAGEDSLYGGNGLDRLSGGEGNDFIDDGGSDSGADTLSGEAGDDTIYGRAGDDVLLGGTGHDSLVGFEGADTVYGGAGDDFIMGADGVDSLIGGDGSDSIFGGAGSEFIDDRGTDEGADTIDGGDGDDTVYGRAGDDVLSGGVGHDSLVGFEGADTVYGGAGDDIIIGADGVDSLIGGDGSDRIFGGAGSEFIDDRGADEGDDTIDGGEGDDTIYGRAGDDVLTGGDGHDSLVGFDGADTVFGGAGDDFIIGAEGVDSLIGGDGSDRIFGGAGSEFIDDRGADEGNDTIDGGEGDDTIYGRAGDDVLTGGDGHDSLVGFDGADTVFGGAGDDFIIGAEGVDSLIGGDGSDRIFGGAGSEFIDDRGADEGNDTIDGGEGDDTLYGRAGDDVLLGGIGHDSLVGFEGADTLYGGAGDDVIIGADGVDSLIGGDGSDRIYGGAGSEFIDDRGSDAGADTIDGGEGDDTVYGRAGDDVLSGSSGNDSLVGFEGADTIYGGVGDDVIVGADDVDSLIGGDGADRIYGGAGDDFIDDRGTDDGADTLYGDAGDDTVYGRGGDDLLSGGDGHDSLVGFEGADTIYGGGGNDVIVGADGADSLIGDDGQDRIYGGAGDDFLDDRGTDAGSDTIDGGAGNDTVYGRAGDDVLSGGDGNDSLVGFEGADTVSGGAGDDVIIGGDGGDSLIGDDGSDSIFGGAGDDFIDDRGFDSADDRLDGGAGNDTIYGRAGDDDLTGGEGNDSLVGFQGDDTLMGGEGDDTLSGGEGADHFVFAPGGGNDLVSDFEAGAGAIDVLDLRGHGFGSRAEVLDVSNQVGTDLIIDLNVSDSIRLVGIDKTMLTDDDFIL